jgi:hypothetical protein
MARIANLVVLISFAAVPWATSAPAQSPSAQSPPAQFTPGMPPDFEYFTSESLPAAPVFYDASAPASPANAPALKCDAKKMEALSKAVFGAHKGVFYDNNFDYLCDPCYCDWWPGDALKRNCLGCGWLSWDIGGQFRMRQHAERNMRGLGLTGRDDDFLLYRTRLYGNLEVSDWFRAYAEMNDAVSNYENFAPRPIEEDRGELLNLFGDVKLWQGDRGALWTRIGRQELLYGQQRLVSPLDWANTRRTFDGAKAFWRGQDWNVDLFYTRPVPNVDGVFNSPSQAQEFMGGFSSYKGFEGQTWDFYYLRFNDATTGAKFDTAGANWNGGHEAWVFDMSGANQWGSFGTASHQAGFTTTGIGRKFENLPWQPTLWGYYDWASGSPLLGNGFHHLFPLGHKYLGFMDFYGRRNIEDANILLTMKPRPDVSLLAWYHVFRLEQGSDVPYTVVMTPFVTVPGGSKDLGEELDTIVSWDVNERWNLLFGYSHYWAGAFYSTNPAAPFAGDADFFYTQSTWNF